MKKSYLEPEAKVLPFALNDIITFSLSENTEGLDDNESIEALFA